MKPIVFLLLILSINCFSQKPNLRNSLVAYYTFDDNKNDASGNFNDGIASESSNLTFYYDRFLSDKGACQFNGKNFIAVKNSESFKKIESEDAISVSFWIKTDKIQPNVLPIISKYKAANNEKWSLQINASGNLEFTSLNNKTIDFKCVLSETSWKQWHNIVFTYSNANQQAKLYIDGELSEEKKFTENIGSTDGNLFIGRATNMNSQIWENRLMDELRIYSRAITSQEVSLLFNSKADITLPEIILTYPDFSKASKVEVTVDTILLKGSVYDESQVKLYFNNDKEVKLKPKFVFEIPLPLKVGVNELIFNAVDSKQNQRKVKLTIERKEQTIKKSKESVSATSFRGPNVVSTTDSLALTSASYYALIIGNNNYQSPQFKKLNEAINDATKLYDVLTKQYVFDTTKVTFLPDAKYETIISKLDSLSEIITSKDNLLIFYAGHGQWDAKKELGYWIPTDAAFNNTAKWIRNSTIQDYIKTIKSKHTLVIADACFSGSLFRSGSENPNNSWAINELYNMQSRKAMTSGTLTTVPDKSVFLQYLVDALQDNKDTYLPSSKLFSNFVYSVMKNSRTIPQYQDIQDVGDRGGQFIFVKRK